jgi:hypothetical protein
MIGFFIDAIIIVGTSAITFLGGYVSAAITNFFVGGDE